MLFTTCQEPERRQEIYAGIKSLEQHCDTLTNRILDELNNTFITPFDREDIHTLPRSSTTCSTSSRAQPNVRFFIVPATCTRSAGELAAIIARSAECLSSAIRELATVRRDPTVVKTECRKLHELENQADDIYENYVTLLFREEQNAIELLKQVEIIQFLENATDKAYRVSDTLKTIVVKYA